MITPLDIENKEFRRGIRGYREDEVEDFLDDLKEDFENLYKENIELKDKINMLSDQISKFKSIEDTLKNTLIVAQNTAEELGISASKKAQLIIEEAEIKGRRIIEDSNNEVIGIKKEYEEIRKESMIFKNRFKSMLKDQMKYVDELFGQEEADLGAE